MIIHTKLCEYAETCMEKLVKLLREFILGRFLPFETAVQDGTPWARIAQNVKKPSLTVNVMFLVLMYPCGSFGISLVPKSYNTLDSGINIPLGAVHKLRLQEEGVGGHKNRLFVNFYIMENVNGRG